MPVSHCTRAHPNVPLCTCPTVHREIARFVWKRRRGLWAGYHTGRCLVIGLLCLLEFVVAYLLLLPSISSISFRLCECNNTATGCTLWSPMVLCYPALLLLHVTMFLACLMVTAVLWMLISMIWGLFGGVARGVGNYRNWTQVQGAMDTLQQDMIMYSPFCRGDSEQRTVCGLRPSHCIFCPRPGAPPGGGWRATDGGWRVPRKGPQRRKKKARASQRPRRLAARLETHKSRRTALPPRLLPNSSVHTGTGRLGLGCSAMPGLTGQGRRALSGAMSRPSRRSVQTTPYDQVPARRLFWLFAPPPPLRHRRCGCALAEVGTRDCISGHTANEDSRLCVPKNLSILYCPGRWKLGRD